VSQEEGKPEARKKKRKNKKDGGKQDVEGIGQAKKKQGKNFT